MTMDNYGTDEYYENKRLERQPIGDVYYVWAMRNGRPLMLGWYATEDEAWQEAGKLDCTPEVVPLKTRDRREAWKTLRKRMWDQGEQLDDVLKRASHQTR